ncbi:hypothetical protein [Ramlibacter sp.]|uniref:hypothetical protein n=1 Tax=Ramlibacter sp. TaxID=1917967 RepID=UPI002C0CD131|nr:hypothetical protein [Ramlibacter sp.]HWI81021.1 hypothetical protein [Ramlibacter sp.]
MYRIERAVSEWHRVYTALCAAQDCLRREGFAQPGGPMAAGQALVAQVDRLQDEEEQALRGIHEALLAAKARAIHKAGPPSREGPAS